MTDVDLERRYETLRQAAAALLAVSAADAESMPVDHRRNLEALAQALDGRGPRAVAREIEDPRTHFLTRRDYGRGVPGGVPRSHAERAQSIRESLALDDADGSPAPEWPQENPALTELTAMTVGALLQELAARLSAAGDPGAAELAAVTLELAGEVLAPTFVGAQR